MTMSNNQFKMMIQREQNHLKTTFPKILLMNNKKDKMIQIVMKLKICNIMIRERMNKQKQK